MIIGIGCDTVEHKVTSEILNWESDKCTLQRIFSANEISLFEVKNSDRYLSGRFAAKEAVLKCLGTGMNDGISLTDIQILQLKNGKPIVKLIGKAKKLSDKKGIDAWHISITHSTCSSYAFVIAESISQI